jgi:hypothetical protein
MNPVFAYEMPEHIGILDQAAFAASGISKGKDVNRFLCTFFVKNRINDT